MKLFNILLFYTFIFVPLYSQTHAIDSLLTSLKQAKNDTNKVNILVKLADKLEDNEPQKAYKFASDGLELSKHLKYKLGEYNSNIYLGNILVEQGDYIEANNKYQECLFLASEMNDSICIAGAYDNLGILNVHLSNSALALEYRQKANTIYRLLGNNNRLASGYIWIGNIHKQQGNYPTALENYLAAFKIYESNNDCENKPYAQLNISSIYRQTKEYNLAKSYSLEAIKCLNMVTNKRVLGAAYYRLSLVYYETQQIDSSIYYLLSAEKIFDDLGDPNFLSIINNLLGSCNQSIGNFDQALLYYNKSLNIANAIGEKETIATALGNIGIAYRMKCDYENALDYIQQALDIFVKSGNKPMQKELLKEFVIIYSGLNQVDSLEKYFLLYENLTDSIYSEVNIASIAEMRTKYDSDKKENENKILKLEIQDEQNTNLLLARQAELTNLELENRKVNVKLLENINKQQLDSIKFQTEIARNEKILRSEEKKMYNNKIFFKNLVILSIVILTILVLGILYYRNRNRKILFEKRVFELTDKAIKSQLNPHFVDNALNAIQKYVIIDPQLVEKYLTKFSYFTHKMLENTDKKQIPLSDEIELIRNYIELQAIRRKGPIDLETKIDPQIDVDDVLVPPAIFQPLVENSFKHNLLKKDGSAQLILTIDWDKGLLKCMLEDHCVGDPIKVNTETANDRKSLGVKIVRERLDLFSKGKKKRSYLDLDKQPFGMIVKLGIPVL